MKILLFTVTLSKRNIFMNILSSENMKYILLVVIIMKFDELLLLGLNKQYIDNISKNIIFLSNIN